MAKLVLFLFSILSLAWGQPWGWRHGWGGGSKSSELSPCYYSVDLCNCPAGTTFAVSHTTQTIGSSAADFRNVSGHFFDVTWEGLTLTATNGRETIPGATRNATIPTSVGTYPVVEKLTKYEAYPDGTFALYFELGNPPIPFQNSKGSFGGYWVTFETTYTGKEETYISWRINSCFTGNPFSFKEFKESSLSNAIKVLKSRGEADGKTFPYSTTSCA